jgi:ribosomal-protein-alanine N-acetyltransferase
MEVRDLAEVQAIEVCSFSNPWHKATFLGEIQNRSIAYPYAAVSDAGHKVIGYILFWLINDEAQVNNIAVHPDYRGQGIGEELMRFALDKIRHLRGTFVTLEVRQSNSPAVKLYEKLGFTLLGVRKGYYQNPAEDAIVLGLDLSDN